MIVVAGGEPPSGDALRGLPPDTFVVAADSGIDGAHAIGLRVDLAVGDFDSASPGAADRVIADGGRIERHPADKDSTDLELALDAALARRPSRIVVLGGAGGRFDHWLAVAFLLASPRYAGVRIQARWAAATVTVVRSAKTLAGAPGETLAGAPGETLAGNPGDVLTLLPVHGAARGVRVDGVRWPLRGEDLAPGTTRGVSNVLVAHEARVSVDAGTLLAVQPH